MDPEHVFNFPTLLRAAFHRENRRKTVEGILLFFLLTLLMSIIFDYPREARGFLALTVGLAFILIKICTSRLRVLFRLGLVVVSLTVAITLVYNFGTPRFSARIQKCREALRESRGLPRDFCEEQAHFRSIEIPGPVASLDWLGSATLEVTIEGSARAKGPVSAPLAYLKASRVEIDPADLPVGLQALSSKGDVDEERMVQYWPRTLGSIDLEKFDLAGRGVSFPPFLRVARLPYSARSDLLPSNAKELTLVGVSGAPLPILPSQTTSLSLEGSGSYDLSSFSRLRRLALTGVGLAWKAQQTSVRKGQANLESEYQELDLESISVKSPRLGLMVGDLPARLSELAISAQSH
jgi:hypothetical protein